MACCISCGFNRQSTTKGKQKRLLSTNILTLPFPSFLWCHAQTHPIFLPQFLWCLFYVEGRIHFHHIDYPKCVHVYACIHVCSISFYGLKFISSHSALCHSKYPNVTGTLCTSIHPTPTSQHTQSPLFSLGCASTGSLHTSWWPSSSPSPALLHFPLLTCYPHLNFALKVGVTRWSVSVTISVFLYKPKPPLFWVPLLSNPKRFAFNRPNKSRKTRSRR